MTLSVSVQETDFFLKAALFGRVERGVVTEIGLVSECSVSSLLQYSNTIYISFE